MHRLACVVAVLCSLSAASEESDVIELTGQNFDASVKNGTESPWFVKFYAPWCGHCKTMAPDWAKLATELKGSVRVANVDAIAEKELAEAWDVDGFPTLKLITKGNVYDYKGGRSIESMREFAQGGYSSKTPPKVPSPPPSNPLIHDLTDDSFNTVVGRASASPWFVKFYAPWCGHCKKLVPIWDTLADQLQDRVKIAKVDATAEVELGADWNVKSYPDLKLLADDMFYNYKGPRNLEALEAFAIGGYKSAEGEKMPSARPPSAAVKLSIKDFYPTVRSRRSRPWFVNFYMPGCGHCISLAPEWERLAKQLVDVVNVAKVDVVKNKDLADAWGVGQFPTLHFFAEGNVYEYTGDRNAEAMQAFAEGEYRNATVMRVLPEPSVLEEYQTAIGFTAGAGFVAVIAYFMR